MTKGKKDKKFIKIGNSTGISIEPGLLSALKITDKDSYKATTNGESIIITPVKKNKNKIITTGAFDLAITLLQLFRAKALDNYDFSSIEVIDDGPFIHFSLKDLLEENKESPEKS
jgi:hypothetical protein